MKYKENKEHKEDKTEEIETSEKLEHHAYLIVDEPDDFEVFFNKKIDRIVLDIEGRTTIEKIIEKDETNLGVKVVYHRYVNICKRGLVIESKTALYNALRTYRNNGADNLFVTKLLVEWTNGDMDIWNRAAFQAKDKEIIRGSNSQRRNALTIPYPSSEEARKLAEKYGEDLVNYTKCLNMETKTRKRICLGTLTGFT